MVHPRQLASERHEVEDVGLDLGKTRERYFSVRQALFHLHVRTWPAVGADTHDPVNRRIYAIARS